MVQIYLPMKNAIAIIITFMLFTLWFLPAFMIYHGFNNGWGGLYVAICILSLWWGSVIHDEFLK